MDKNQAAIDNIVSQAKKLCNRPIGIAGTEPWKHIIDMRFKDLPEEIYKKLDYFVINQVHDQIEVLFNNLFTALVISDLIDATDVLDNEHEFRNKIGIYTLVDHKLMLTPFKTLDTISVDIML